MSEKMFKLDDDLPEIVTDEFLNDNGATGEPMFAVMTQAVQHGQPFVVDSDTKAEWALKKIHAIRAERDRLVRVCDEQIGFYMDRRDGILNKADQDEAFFVSMLHGYFQNVPHRITKTQEQYALPSGKLVARKKPDTFERGDGLVNELQQIGMADYLEFKPSVKWAELKERVTVIDGAVHVVDADGELHPSDQIKFAPGATVFEVKA